MFISTKSRNWTNGNSSSDFGVMTRVQQDTTPYPVPPFSTGPWFNHPFSSQNFPGFYPRDTECQCLFHGNTNYGLHLLFLHFDL
ncbi:hypothetical protein J6590_067506 [Homalodisca vitripennis]|nr:hypothetical protein J6590_067506 [Homalodisca vitripennis]